MNRILVNRSSKHFVTLNTALAICWSVLPSAQAQTLAEALDTTELVWSTGGYANWFGQTSTTHDGVDAASSGLIGHLQTNWMETTVTGPCILSFWWKVSSEPDFDWLTFYLDDVPQASRSGEVGWQSLLLFIPSGSHVCRWQYSKDDSVNGGADRSWVDQVQIMPPTPLAEALDTTDLVWSYGGSLPWFGQTTDTHDGSDAARSGPIFAEQESWMQISVGGPGTLSFWWSVSSEPDFDYLELRINGILVSRISGNLGWHQYTQTLGTGLQRVRWRYVKDPIMNVGQDCGWVDEVTYVPDGPPPDLIPVAGIVDQLVRGRSLSLVTVVTNRGDGAALGSWSDAWYWSADTEWGPDDTYLSVSSRSGPVEAGGSYTRTNSLLVPTETEGPHYLLIRVDCNDSVYEGAEGNNELALAVSALPDLAVVGVEWLGAAVAGERVEVVSVVTNRGSGSAGGSWSDYLYLSTDGEWDAGDVRVATYTWSGGVEVGGVYRRTNSVLLPEVAGGPYYLIVRADEKDGLYELAEGNNALAVPFTLTVPDLIPTSLSWGGIVPTSGKALTVVWTVANAGDGDAYPSWYDAIYYSSDAVWDAGDTSLRTQSRSQALPPGTNYQVTNTVTIPPTAPATYYLIIRSDYRDALFESDETNNWRAFVVDLNGDTDSDGIPDSWEREYFASIEDCAPDQDADGDGLSALQEYLADTNPTNALSVLRISQITLEGGGLRVRWQGGVAAKQLLERNDDASLSPSNWVVRFTNVPPTSIQTNRFDPPGTNRTLFYRIRAVRE